MDLICFCHLRWNFVYQRPQHLMARFAKSFRVFYVEEPVYDGVGTSYLETVYPDTNIQVLVPHLPAGLSGQEINEEQNNLLQRFLSEKEVEQPIAWFYTPMAISYMTVLPTPTIVVYDCMDELTAFKNAPAGLAENEKQLMLAADLVFTGGYSLYNAKRTLHQHVYPFPSSIDKQHFVRARKAGVEPEDQMSIAGPKIGFFGVIDERLDIQLLEEIASLRSDCNFILIGPVVKIDPATLPQNPNIHYLGARSYDELPQYLSGWDVAMIPFALNESTQFISPTKTPEYLAGGKPVISTAITDVVNPYGRLGMVWIADTAADFSKGIDWGLSVRNDSNWIKAVDAFLVDNSWDLTWEKMLFTINTTLESKQTDTSTRKQQLYV